MKVAWSVGHDPVHSGAFSKPLDETEHKLARLVVEAGIEAAKMAGVNWEFLNPSDHVNANGKSAGRVLNEKIAMLNEWGADVAIESHFNSSASEEARGCETLYFSLPIGNRFSPEGKALAELVQAETLKSLNDAPIRAARPALMIRDRGAKGMADLRRVYNGREVVPRYAFLCKTKMPALILEPLFISSPIDTVALAKDRKREIHRLAIGVVTALLKWEKQGDHTA